MNKINGWWYDNVYLGVPDDEEDELEDDYEPDEDDYDNGIEEDYYL